MWKFNDPVDPGASPEGDGSGKPAHSRRRRAAAIVTSLTVAGAMLFGAQALNSPEEAHAVTGGAVSGPALAAAPAPGSTWIQGVITDQCAQGQDDVNVEAWPMTTATAPAASALTYGGPAASALTYGGPRYDAGQGHGFFRLEVPSDQAYRIAFSAVGGQEDGDPFQMMWYGQNRPIMVRIAAKAAALVVAPGRIRDLGTIPLARQGQAASTTTAVVRQAKVRVGTRGKLHVTVASGCITDVSGEVVAKVAGHKVSRKLTPADHGSRVVRLPKFKHPGKYLVHVRFAGAGTTQGSKAKPVKVKVV